MDRRAVSLHPASRYPHRMLQADSSQSRQHARLTTRDQFVCRPMRNNAIDPARRNENEFIQSPCSGRAAVRDRSDAGIRATFRGCGRPVLAKNLSDSGYDPKNDFNSNDDREGRHPGAGPCSRSIFRNLDVLNEVWATPAARLSPDWPALKGACASAGGGITYCGEPLARRLYFAPDASPRPERVERRATSGLVRAYSNENARNSARDLAEVLKSRRCNRVLHRQRIQR